MTVPSLPDDLRVRLEALAARKDRSVDDCVRQAIVDFVENWEEYYSTVDTLQDGVEVRPVLKTAPGE